MAELGRVACAVLAAGASRRMGANKMLLELGGEPLVRRAARRAHEAALSPVVVVTGFEPDRVRGALAGIECVFATNPDYTGSTSGSLHAALRELPADADAVMVMLADMVHVSSEMLRALVALANESGAPLVVSRYGDVKAPPLLFRRALFAELLAWHGEGCGKEVVRTHAAEAAYAEWPEAALADVDTPDDWKAVMRAGARA